MVLVRSSRIEPEQTRREQRRRRQHQKRPAGSKMIYLSFSLFWLFCGQILE